MQEFKVGDLVRQRLGASFYSITNSDLTTVLRVESVNTAGKLRVEVVEHYERKYIGKVFPVNPNCMCLIGSSNCVIVNSLDYQDSDDLTAEDKDIIREFLENV